MEIMYFSVSPLDRNVGSLFVDKNNKRTNKFFKKKLQFAVYFRGEIYFLDFDGK